MDWTACAMAEEIFGADLISIFWVSKDYQRVPRWTIHLLPSWYATKMAEDGWSVLDTQKMEIRLPEDKHEEIKHLTC